MSVYIVDTSVAAKWFLEEVHTEAAMRVLNPSHELHAPDLLSLEMASVVCKRIRRREITPGMGREIRNALHRLPLRTHSFLTLLEPAYEIAVGTHCTVYDALYVALAVLLGGRMVTADRRLLDRLAAGPLGGHIEWVEDVA